ncbi:MAG: hypothetical protein M0T70_02470 [Geobacteraceae bacterium]|nr:hypothetical protein [Geobacteraceae bacterium]
MERIKIITHSCDPATVTYDPVTDVWVSKQGFPHIKNEFIPEHTEWIDITLPWWTVVYNGNLLSIDWTVLDHKPGFQKAFQAVAKEKLKKSSLAYIADINLMLTYVAPLLKDEWQDFADVSTSDVLRIWEELKGSYKIVLREFYRQMVDMGIGGAKSDVAYELKSWKARNDTVVLRDVLSWHETRGALTSSEEKVLREVLSSGEENESYRECAVRIFAWLLLDTLKRPSQILTIRKDGLREVKSANGTSEWFVEIKPVKHQAGLPSRWWRVSEELAKAIIAFSEWKSVAKLQAEFDKMIVWDCPSLLDHGVVASVDAKSELTNYIAKRKVRSPRTKKSLHVTPTRIRHTGATRLAFQGVSRDLISEILEHDSPDSAQFYIDAAGVEIVPEIERAGRQMGNIFYELNKGFFQGRLVPELGDQPPVFVPEASPTPLIVGTCSRDTLKDGACPRHPFLACYDGCSCFYAWNNPDPHGKALEHFEKEIERWKKSIEAAEQQHMSHLVADKTLASYQRAVTAVQEVLSQIKG